MEIFIYITVFLIGIGKVLRKYSFSILSPIYQYLIFGITTIIFSAIYFYFFTYRFSLFGLDEISYSSFNLAIEYYFVSFIAFIVGANINYIAINKAKRSLTQQKLNLTWEIPDRLTNSLFRFSKYFFPLTYFFIFILFGKQLFIRCEYLSSEISRSGMLLVQLVGFLGSILASLIYEKKKVLTAFYFGFLMILFFTTGSRVGVLFLMIFIGIKFVLQPTHKTIDWMKLVAVIILILFYLAFVMHLRGLESHGLIPYLSEVLYIDSSIFRDFFFNIYYIFIYGVFVTVKTMSIAVKDWSIIFTNINPLPGSMAGWYEFSKTRRINVYAPFSTHGEVFSMGKWFTFCFYVAVGFIISYLDVLVRKLISRQHYFSALIINLLIVLHIFYSFEYNMRSSIRYIYYALAFVVILWAFRFIKRVLIYLSHLDDDKQAK